MDIDSLWTGADGKFDPVKATSSLLGAAGIYGALNPDSKIGQFVGAGSRNRPVGYTAGVPEYEISRSLVPNAFASTTPTGEPRRPGSGGRRYFSDTTYTPTGKPLGQTTAPVNTGGVFGALSPEAVQSLLSSMFGSGGVSGGATTPVTPSGGVTTTPASPSPAPKYTDAQVKGTLDTLIAQYPNDREGLYRAIAQQIKDSGVPIADAAQQLSGIVQVDGAAVTPQEIEAEYRRLGFAQGGLASLPQSKGYYLGGATDGMADKIPASINGKQPAALSDGEFVVPADVVSHLGNGNSDSGAQQLYSMMDRVREARTGRREQGRKINPTKFMPV